VRISSDGGILDSQPHTIASAKQSVITAAASNGKDFFVMWEGDAIYGQSVGADGTPSRNAPAPHSRLNSRI